MNLGIAIKELRKKKGMSQVTLSQIVGMTQANLSLIESGKHDRTIHLRKIAEVLGVPTPVLYILAIEPEDIPDGKLEKYNMLFPFIKELIFKLVE